VVSLSTPNVGVELGLLGIGVMGIGMVAPESGFHTVGMVG
jgi:hypothetical protein